MHTILHSYMPTYKLATRKHVNTQAFYHDLKMEYRQDGGDFAKANLRWKCELLNAVIFQTKNQIL